mgnify:CR=1 FL=1
MKKKLFKSLVALFLLGSTLSVASCGNRDNPTTDNPITGGDNPQTTTVTPTTSNTPTSTSSEQQSPIKSLTAKQAKVELKLGDSRTADTFYDIKGYSALNNKQKACTYTSSNEEAIKVNKKRLEAVGVGTSTITVTSNVDSSKFCSFEINVKDVYFDRTLSKIAVDDDFSKELIDDGGIIESTSMETGDYFIRGINSTTWMAEVEISIKEVREGEDYPKFGLVATSLDNAADGHDNRAYFFLNAEIGTSKNYSWKNFGFCEVFNGSGWAWNDGITNTIARHADGCYSLPNGQTITTTKKYTEGSSALTKFKMKVAHDGLDFHMWINDNYAASMKVLDYLFTDAEGNAVNSTCGFFQFNSDVVYENYSATQDATAVRDAINGIENVRFLADSDWAED